MNYFEFRIRFADTNKDEIENLLYLNGVENMLEEESEILTYIESPLKWKSDELKNNLIASGIVTDEDITINEFEDKNWDDLWQRTIEPVEISDRIIVYPSWKHNEVEKLSGKILIQIDPKMSFGTGHNETTQLMLEMMVKNLNGNESKILDYGCGTAVLSIAGVKLGVKEAVAIDDDPDVIENAKEYIEGNKVSDKIKVLCSDLQGLSDSGFDVICANIIRSVIEKTFALMDLKLDIGGKMMLSGFLREEFEPIIKLLIDCNYSPIEINSKAEWLGVYAVKQK